jgi:nucleotide-binding universal stress UspA family protein
MSAGVLVLFESGEDGVTALHQAAELALEREAELTVVTVAPQDTSARSCGPGRSLYNQHVRELAEHDLQNAREALPELAGQAIFTTLVQGRDPELAHWAAARDFDVIVVPRRRWVTGGREARRLRRATAADVHIA